MKHMGIGGKEKYLELPHVTLQGYDRHLIEDMDDILGWLRTMYGICTLEMVGRGILGRNS